MPTANSLNSKPRPAMGMGMKPVDPKKFRVETVAQKPSPAERLSPFSRNASSPKSRPSASHASSQKTSVSRSATPRNMSPAASSARHRDVSRSARSSISKRASPAVRTPPTPMFDDDDDDDSDSDDAKVATKKRRLDTEPNLDTSRVIFYKNAFDKESARKMKMVHAANIAHESNSEKPNSHFHNFFTTEMEDGVPLEHSVELQYPSFYPKEQYNLVAPKEKDDFKPIDEILRIMTTVSSYYLDESDSEYVADETSGLIMQLRRAIKKDNLSDFHDLIKKYNVFLRKLLENGTIMKTLSTRNSPLQLPWVEQVLNQTYSRTVSLRVESLRRYENGTDNVYGELLPRFISNIFKETALKSDQVFVDLGSGVGNVVLQAALEIGCESWGCEMMPNACDLAELQEKEFSSRCRLWGLKPGPVRLERGDFLSNMPTLSALKRADVVLVNNQAFTPSLNDKLIMHFLDLKEGCQIVSLKSFVPQGHKIQARNVDSPINLLVDRELRYFSDSVSWTDAPGTYHVARKDGRRLDKFIRRGMS